MLKICMYGLLAVGLAVVATAILSPPLGTIFGSDTLQHGLVTWLIRNQLVLLAMNHENGYGDLRFWHSFYWGCTFGDANRSGDSGNSCESVRHKSA